MKILWLVGENVLHFAAGPGAEKAIFESPSASARMRVAVAASSLKSAGHQNVFLDPGAPDFLRSTDWRSFAVCIVPKFHFDSPLKAWSDACAAAVGNGCRLILDLCDYPFRKPQPVQAFYAATLRICDVLVVNSARMAELLVPHVSHAPQLIEDAVLGRMKDAAFAPGARLRLLWFGHPSNLKYLDACVGGLVGLARERPCRLTVVTEDGHGALEAVRYLEQRFGPALEARFVEWSPERLEACFERCDIVLIPSDPADLLKSGASANRIAEAVNAGRFAVASPVPSYLAFADSAWVGEDLMQGVRWALAHPDETLARIRRGQDLVAEKFAAGRIGARWQALVEGLGSARPA